METLSILASSHAGIKVLLLYLIVLLVILLTIFWKEHLAIYLLVLLLPLQTVRYHLHALPLGANIVDLLLLSAIAGRILRPRPTVPLPSIIPKLLLAIAIFDYLSLWRGAHFLGVQYPLWFNDSRLVDLKNYLVMPAMALIAASVISTRKQIAIILLLCALTLAAVDYSDIKTAAGRSFNHYSEQVRDSGPLGYAGENGLASYLVEATVLLIPFISVGKFRNRALLAGLVAGTTYLILFTYSREAYLGFLFGLLFLGVARYRWILLPLVVLIFTWQIVLPRAVQERVLMTYQANSDDTAHSLDASAEERVALLDDALNLAHENPLLGSGFLTYAYMQRVGPYRDTHDYYLKMLVETGAIGLVFFVVVLAAFFLAGIRLFRSARTSEPLLSSLGLGFAALLVANCVVNAFGDRWMFIQVTSNLWIVLGCVLTGQRMIATEPAAVALPENHTSRPARRRAIGHAVIAPSLSRNGTSIAP